MSNKTTDYINPYSNVAALYKSGMDYIITCMTTSSSSSSDCDCSDVTVDHLIDCVCTYITSVLHSGGLPPALINPLEGLNLKVAVTNAVNGYLNKGDISIIACKGIKSVPVNSIGNYFDRLDQAIQDSETIRSSKSNGQLALSIGRATYEYWNSKIGSAVVSPWSVYFDGNPAIDTINIPYWISAAMFGSQYNFWQDNATDSEAVANAMISSLGGALIVGAGKVIFKWVPKVEDDMIADFIENFE